MQEKIVLSKEEYKARRMLEEAQKRGMVSVSTSDKGGTEFRVNTPYMEGTFRKPTTTMPDVIKKKPVMKLNEWYARGEPQNVVFKFREGACQNCGAMTHKAKDCLDRPRKVGAKYSGKDFKGDEDIRELVFDYEGKIDTWNGYNPESYLEVVKEYELLNSKISEKHNQNGTDVDGDFKEKLHNRQYLDTEFDPKTKSSQSLRQRGDMAKYLLNLDDDAPAYDGKSRVLNGNPTPDVDLSSLEFKGDDYHKYTGDTIDFLSQDTFAWQHVKKYNSELNSVAMPTLTEMLHKKSQAKNNLVRGKIYEELSKRYGGEGHFQEPIEGLLISKEQYTEFDENGKLIENKHVQKQGKSKYPEDVYPQDHTSVWGSWWNKQLGWGFSCCHGTDRNAICLGDKGKKIAVIKEYRLLKRREAEMKFDEHQERNDGKNNENSKRLQEIEQIIEDQKIHINSESHKQYEKQLAEINQRKIEDEKNSKFQKSFKENRRERSRSQERK
jgi:pre-mRNA-processing factor SLU7